MDKEYIAMGKEVYLSFTQDELDQCKTIAGVYYCEDILKLKHISQHTCASAIFFNQTQLIPELCTVKIYENYKPKPEIIEGQDYLIFVGMPSPWRIYCDKALDIPIKIKESSLAIIPRKQICISVESAQEITLYMKISSHVTDKK